MRGWGRAAQVSTRVRLLTRACDSGGGVWWLQRLRVGWCRSTFYTDAPVFSAILDKDRNPRRCKPACLVAPLSCGPGPCRVLDLQAEQKRVPPIISDGAMGEEDPSIQSRQYRNGARADAVCNKVSWLRALECESDPPHAVTSGGGGGPGNTYRRRPPWKSSPYQGAHVCPRCCSAGRGINTEASTAHAVLLGSV